MFKSSSLKFRFFVIWNIHIIIIITIINFQFYFHRGFTQDAESGGVVYDNMRYSLIQKNCGEHAFFI